MKVAFVCAPYRAETPRGIVENIRRAETIALDLWRMGYAVICPHLNTALFDGALPDGVWLEGDLAILRKCDLMVVTEGPLTEGQIGEVSAASDLMPIYRWPGAREALALDAK